MFLFLKHRMKMFCVCHHISTSFNLSQGQSRNIAMLAFTKLADIPSFAPHNCKSLTSSLIHSNLFWRLTTSRWILLLGVSWKVPWYSAKRIYWNILWGLYKEMPTNTQGQSDIVTHSTNIWNKVFSFQKAFFCQRDFSRQTWEELMINP